ncbi:MAG: thiamine phosphate synthase [Planctomycetes bacterium]|nr:thiamine phosphate synthase [Planctomycetota bacterium]
MRALGPLILISDAERVGEERFLEAAALAVSAGLRAILVREPDWSEERVEGLIRRLRERLAGVGSVAGTGAGAGGEPVAFLVGRRPALAARLGLAGVHMPGQGAELVSRARTEVGPGLLVGYSAHRLEEIGDVARAGADYVTYSPVFGATSKRQALPPVGLEGLEAACRASSVHVYALGGVGPAHAASLRRAGAAGAAAIGLVLDAADPARAVREFLEGWEAA